jgi:hypothetical protein
MMHLECESSTSAEPDTDTRKGGTSKLTEMLVLQEYMSINKPVLDFIVLLGSDTALVSDAGRALLEIKKHFDNLPNDSLRRISKENPAADLAQLKALMQKRVEKSLTDAHYLALFLDPRPSIRKFVNDSRLAGDAESLTLGNTPALHRAKAALQAMAPALSACRKDETDSQVVQDTYQALMTYLQVMFCHAVVLFLYCFRSEITASSFRFLENKLNKLCTTNCCFRCTYSQHRFLYLLQSFFHVLQDCPTKGTRSVEPG